MAGSDRDFRRLVHETFYAGAQFMTLGNSCRTYDWEGSKAMIERMMDGYDLTAEVNRRKTAAQAAE